jgi:hypothetical protein
MSRKVGLLILLQVISGFTNSVLAAELLKNGGFENVSSAPGYGWIKWGTNANVVSDSGYYQGSASAVVFWSDSGWYQEYSGAQAGDSFTLEGDMIYPGSSKLTSRNAYLKLEFWDNFNLLQATEVGVLTPGDSANQWYHYSGTAAAPAGTVKVRVAVFTYDPSGTGSGKAYFDNISLTKIPPVSGPDYNRDQIVDFSDFGSFAGAWLTNSVSYDLDGDGFVDGQDLRMLANDWLDQIPDYTGYEFVWSDEFYGFEVNSQNWTYQIMGDGGNQELQYYTDRPANSWVEDGCLVIQALKENYRVGSKTYAFTSARLRTINKQDFMYGKLEARIKVPTGQGMWPAFWMMPTDSAYGGWAASGEIDIMETANATNFIDGTIHYGGGWPENVHSGGTYMTVPSTDFSDDFHIYSVEWDMYAMRWYVDGHLYSTETSWGSTGGSFPAPFNQRFHFILNIAVGGTYTGCTSSSCVTATFPQQMLVDWVRVYRKM